jgi:hypothetical protein
MKRAELLKQSKETLEESKVTYQVEVDKLQLQRDILETKSSVASLEAKLLQLKSAKVLSPSDIVSVANELAAYKEGMKQLVALEKELF